MACGQDLQRIRPTLWRVRVPVAGVAEPDDEQVPLTPRRVSAASARCGCSVLARPRSSATAARVSSAVTTACWGLTATPRPRGAAGPDQDRLVEAHLADVDLDPVGDLVGADPTIRAFIRCSVMPPLTVTCLASPTRWIGILELDRLGRVDLQEVDVGDVTADRVALDLADQGQERLAVQLDADQRVAPASVLSAWRRSVRRKVTVVGGLAAAVDDAGHDGPRRGGGGTDGSRWCGRSRR